MALDQKEILKPFKIIILGESGVGKSCILLRFIEDNFTFDMKPTIGVDFRVGQITVDGREIKLGIWDTAGQERFRSITPSYYRDAHGAILVYDITNETSFKRISTWLQDMKDLTQKETVTMVVGNKSDLSEKRMVSKKEGMDFARLNNLLFMETSAKESVDIELAFSELVRKIMQTPNLLESSQGDEIQLSNKPVGKRNCFCASWFGF